MLYSPSMYHFRSISSEGDSYISSPLEKYDNTSGIAALVGHWYVLLILSPYIC
jgi:hypothetical protein